MLLDILFAMPTGDGVRGREEEGSGEVSSRGVGSGFMVDDVETEELSGVLNTSAIGDTCRVR